MPNTPNTKDVYQALDEARAAFPPIVKNKTAKIPTKNGQSYSYKYADLEGILRAVEPVLREHGLGVFQAVHNGLLVTEVKLLDGMNGDVRGLSCDIPLPAGVDPQRFGSAITYARRYGIVCLLGLVTEDDDDGAAATHGRDDPDTESAPSAPRQTRQKPIRPPSEAAGGPVDPAGGWDSPAQRAAEHERLKASMDALSLEQIEELRKLSVALGGFPLPKDKFDELEAATRLLLGGTE
jgi:ERF superfamily